MTMGSLRGKTALITGASSGIGRACAELFAREGARLILSARRGDRISALIQRLVSEYATEAIGLTFDIRKQREIQDAVESLPTEWKQVDILVNNAGLSRGLDKLHEGSLQDWEEMIDTNVKGLLYMTRLILPGMAARKSGHVVNIGSVAGHQLYPGGNVYCASKFAVRAISEGMRLDLLGTHVRVTSIDPGMVETEFSQVRFHGDAQRAAQVYANFSPLQASDVADTVWYCVTRPPHVDVAEVLLMPTDQGSATHSYRTPAS
jgi:3-hydroxy acid dehydrogenase/malonic semialdehyde reductase